MFTPGRGTLNCACLEDMELPNANLDDVVAEGVMLMVANLAGASLRRADLYWAVAMGVNLDGADPRDADLRGAGHRVRFRSYW